VGYVSMCVVCVWCVNVWEERPKGKQRAVVCGVCEVCVCVCRAVGARHGAEVQAGGNPKCEKGRQVQEGEKSECCVRRQAWSAGRWEGPGKSSCTV